MSRAVESLLLGSAPGPVLHLWTLGASMNRLEVTGGDGVRRDVVLGHDTVEERLAGTDFRGAVVGRCANRIAHGDLPLPGGSVPLPTNDRGHHLHGGPDGFGRRVWEIDEHDGASARLSLVSPDGDQGYPGELRLSATYAVTADRVDLRLAATTDATTVVNPTHHAYVDLAGVGSGTVADHRLRVPASRYTPVDATGIPLGDHAYVTGTPFDLRVGVPLPQDLDHNFVLHDGDAGSGLRTVAVLSHAATRTEMTLSSDLPGLQVYTANAGGVALEPQFFPDSPHHPGWPSVLLEPGQTYRSAMSWRFATTDA